MSLWSGCHQSSCNICVTVLIFYVVYSTVQPHLHPFGWLITGSCSSGTNIAHLFCFCHFLALHRYLIFDSVVEALFPTICVRFVCQKRNICPFLIFFYFLVFFGSGKWVASWSRKLMSLWILCTPATNLRTAVWTTWTKALSMTKLKVRFLYLSYSHKSARCFGILLPVAHLCLSYCYLCAIKIP